MLGLFQCAVHTGLSESLMYVRIREVVSVQRGAFTALLSVRVATRCLRRGEQGESSDWVVENVLWSFLKLM